MQMPKTNATRLNELKDHINRLRTDILRPMSRLEEDIKTSAEFKENVAELSRLITISPFFKNHSYTWMYFQ